MMRAINICALIVACAFSASASGARWWFVNSSPASVPAGASANGYTKAIIDERPVAADVTIAANGSNSKWFTGSCFSGPVSNASAYTDIGGQLAIAMGNGVISTPIDSTDGALPLLSGRTGFYVEFDVYLTSDNADHWPALWLLPIEHCNYGTLVKSKYPGEPVINFERFMELDVHEGNFGSGGLFGSVHHWTGAYNVTCPPAYCDSFTSVDSGSDIDHSQPHTFGAAYLPATNTVKWYLDGALVGTSTTNVTEAARRQNFYLIIGAQTHNDDVDYKLVVRRVRAFVP